MKRLIILAVAASGLVLAGCQSFPTPTPPTGSRATPSSASIAGAVASSTAGGQALGANGMNRVPSSGPGSSPKLRTIYFAFNKSVVQSQYFSLLKNQATYLTVHPNIRVLLAGYTDDRGTWEYNIGLGSRRAAAVRQFLLLQGADANQIKTISYGEAYPADPQNNGAAWAKNRRVVIEFQVGK